MNTPHNHNVLVPMHDNSGTHRVLMLIVCFILSVISVYAQTENTADKANQWLNCAQTLALPVVFHGPCFHVSFPTKPAPFDRQGITENDLVDFTPELRSAALSALSKYNYGSLYTPPSLQKPTILMPGIAGGASWAGAAFDLETATLYIPSNTIPYAITLEKSTLPNAEYVGKLAAVETIAGVPIWKPPYGRMTAINMNVGDHRLMIPVGDLAQSVPELKKLELSSLGRSARSHVLLTKTLLIVGQEGTPQREEIAQVAAAGRGVTAGITFKRVDPKPVAFNKETGNYIGEVELPRNATSAPMTYMLNGKQYLVVATGGANLPAELIALRLP